jgi:hypothetical protein
MAKKKKNISFTKSLLIPPQQGESSPIIDNPRLGKRLILRKRDPKLSMLNSINRINKVMKKDTEEDTDKR